jgi:hypothetical protein
MLQVIKLKETHLPLLEEFCDAARIAGYSNNSSPKKMKFGGHADLGVMPHFWGLLKDDKLTSVGGCHFWPDAEKNYTTLRCLFRSATLPEYDGIIPGMSKNHMNSVPFSIFLPYQLQYGIANGAKDFLITTSHGEHDASGKMKRTHRALELLAKRGLVKFHREHIVYHVPQTLWRINLPAYHNALKAFHPMRELLGITGLDDIYTGIITNGF